MTTDETDTADTVETDTVRIALSIASDAGLAFGLDYAGKVGCHRPDHDHDADHAPGTLADMLDRLGTAHTAMLVSMCARDDSYGAEMGLVGALHTVISTWCTFIVTVDPDKCRDADCDHASHDADDGGDLLFGRRGWDGNVTLYPVAEIDVPDGSDHMRGMVRLAGELYVLITKDRDDVPGYEDRVGELIESGLMPRQLRDGVEVFDAHELTRRMVTLLSIYTSAYAMVVDRTGRT